MGIKQWHRSDMGTRGPMHFARIDPTVPKEGGRLAPMEASIGIAPPFVKTETTNYANERAFADADEHGVQTLFDHKELQRQWNIVDEEGNDQKYKEKLGTATVAGLFYRKGESTRDLPAILGAAQMASWQKWGTVRGTLGASGDLSPHSAPIVERAKQRGAIPSDSSTEVTNQNDRADYIGNFSTQGAERVKPFQLQQGKSVYRAVMGRQRPDHTPEPMNQLNLGI